MLLLGVGHWAASRDSPNAIKAQQAEFGAEPEIAIGRLCDSVNDAFGEPVAHLPCGVGVLADVERGIQRKGERAAREPNAQYDDRLCELSFRPPEEPIFIVGATLLSV